MLSVPLLAEMVLSRRKEGIDLNNRVRIEIHTSSFRATRGYTCIGCVADEVCFWATSEEGSANPDTEVLAALRPSLATVPNALLICISSPYAERGEMWKQYRQNWGQDNPDILCWQSSSRDMNPTLSALTVKMAYVRDAASARAEYGGEFRDDVETFLSMEQLEPRVVAGRKELPYRSDLSYVAFADPSGGRSDSFVLGIAHLESVRRSWTVCANQAPFSPEAAVQELAAICAAYKIREVTGDAYGGEWARESFARWGINYRLSDKNRSELYLAFLPGLMSDQVVLLDHGRLLNQLCSLERRTARSGRDSIDHPIGSHDDCANAACGVLTLILEHNITHVLGIIELHREIAEGKRPIPGTKPVSVSGYRRPECPPCVLGKNADGSKMEGHATRYSPTGQILCDCGSVDGILSPVADNHCPNYPGAHDFVTTGGVVRCRHCGNQKDLRPMQAFNGISRAQLKAGSLRAMGQFVLRG